MLSVFLGGVATILLNFYGCVVFMLSIFIIIGKMSFWFLSLSGIFI